MARLKYCRAMNEEEDRQDSVYSLGCQLCERFSIASNDSTKLTKYENFINNEKHVKRQKMLLHKRKKRFFSLLLKKEPLNKPKKYESYSLHFHVSTNILL